MVLAFQLSGGNDEKYYNAVLNVVLLFTTMSYIFIFPTLIKLRYSHAEVQRPYKVPFGMAGVWICGVLTTFWAVLASLVGLVFYAMGRKTRQQIAPKHAEAPADATGVAVA